MSERPAVRLLEPVPFEHEGETLIALRDNAKLGDGVMVLQPIGYYLLRYLDGSRTRAQILEAFQADTGQELPGPILDDLLVQLDRHCVLDNEHSRGVLASFDARPAAHAGGAYPEQPEKLKLFLKEILALESPLQTMDRQLVGLVAPHIDLARGDRCYSFAYGELLQHKPATMTAVVLGISHSAAHQPFVLTRKSFETPLGLVETDQEAVEFLAQACDFDPFQDEFNHFGEHSVEFQAVFLRHLYPEPDTFKMVPVLCGSFHQPLRNGGRPEQIPGVESFLAGLGQLLQQREDAFLIAGADLAHVGVTFGGSPLSDSDLSELEAKDLETMKAAVRGDGLGFFRTLQADGGCRGYCGTSAIYTLVETLKTDGLLHQYQQCSEPGNASTVSVAAAGFYR